MPPAFVGSSDRLDGQPGGRRGAIADRIANALCAGLTAERRALHVGVGAELPASAGVVDVRQGRWARSPSTAAPRPWGSTFAGCMSGAEERYDDW